jgi:outer membrane protein
VPLCYTKVIEVRQMKTKTITIITTAAFMFFLSMPVMAQDKEWTLTDCIDYALRENISVRKADLSTNIGQISLQQAKDNRLPNLNSSIGHNYSWDQSNSDTISTSTSFGINSGVTLYNGLELRNNIKKAEINYEALKYNSLETKESISLSLLNAYLQVLYAEEQVATCQEQVTSTTEELRLASERQKLGGISISDYLQVKAQLASQKQTLASAVNTLEIDKVTLMQLMELPISDSFTIARPDLNSIIAVAKAETAEDVYSTALEVKPEVKSAALSTEESEVNLKLAKSGYYPSISMSAGISTGLSGINKIIVTGPLKDRLSSTLGVTASIPIFSKWSNRSSVSTAKVNIAMAQLEEINVKNQLRKKIEQACLDARSAAIEYEATLESYESAKESYNVASEKFNGGSMNSVDFLSVKTTLIQAESSLLQAKYQLVFSDKIIDFYKGIPLSL